MNRQQIRQAARRKALEGREEWRRERAKKDKRLEGLVVDVLVAVAERDQAIREIELRAACAVRSMLAEGLSPSEVSRWCGDGVSERQVRRFAYRGNDGKPTAQDEIGQGPVAMDGEGQDGTSEGLVGGVTVAKLGPDGSTH